MRCALVCATATKVAPPLPARLQAGVCGVECKTVERAAEQIMGEHDTDVAEALFVVSELPAAWSRGCLVHSCGWWSEVMQAPAAAVCISCRPPACVQCAGQEEPGAAQQLAVLRANWRVQAQAAAAAQGD